MTTTFDEFRDLLTPEHEEEGSPADSLPTSDFVVTCPDCDERFEGKTARGAGLKLTWHRRKEHGLAGKPEKAPRNPDAPRETRRKSGAELLAMAASGIGSLLAGIGSPAAGMALKLEAPLVGPAADRAISGTVVDRVVLQKALAAKGKFDQIGPLIAFPLLVALAERQPAMRAQLYGPLRMCVMPMLPQLVKAMQKQAADAQKMAEAAQDLADMDPAWAELFSAGTDPIDAILSFLLPPEMPDGSQAFDDAPGG